MTTAIELSYSDLAIAALLVLLNAALSLYLRLKLERQILIAAARMLVQLSLVGLVLTALFAIASPAWTACVAFLMVALAGREAMARQERRFRGWWAYTLGTTTMLVAASFVTLLALTTQIRPDPWYEPRYAIPLLGMILGNTLSGISLGLDTLTTTAVRERASVEARLALGATRWQALEGVTRQALRSGLMPIINTMSATGLVSLPGMMTGQILAGAEPRQAVMYQLLILFLIAGGTGLGVLTAVFGGVYRLTDERHRLRLGRLAPPRTV